MYPNILNSVDTLHSFVLRCQNKKWSHCIFQSEACVWWHMQVLSRITTSNDQWFIFAEHLWHNIARFHLHWILNCFTRHICRYWYKSQRTWKPVSRAMVVPISSVTQIFGSLFNYQPKTCNKLVALLLLVIFSGPNVEVTSNSCLRIVWKGVKSYVVWIMQYWVTRSFTSKHFSAISQALHGSQF